MAFFLFISTASSFNQFTLSPVLFVNEHPEHSASSTGTTPHWKMEKTTEYFCSS